MIVKISKGNGFRGVVEYLLRIGKTHDEHSAIIGGNMAGKSPRELAHEFGGFRKLRPTLGRAVAHFSISLPPDDRRPDDAEWETIAERFIHEMGFSGSPFIIVRHDDTEHPHIHILASRINVSGEVVADKNDYRRAEEIVRRIEVTNGFRAVPAPTKKPKKRSKTMSKITPASTMQAPHNTPVDIAIDGFNTFIEADTASCYAGDQPNEKKRREMRRAIREPSYDQMVSNLLGADLKHIYHHQKGAVIYTTDGGRIHDHGDKLTIYHTDNKIAAKRMVALAVARGWTSIVFTGPEEFIREAMQEAIAQGLAVHPKDSMQQAILQEILDVDRGAIGVASALVPKPTLKEPEALPEPIPDLPMNLAERLKKRREYLATHQPTNQQRKPGMR